MYCICDKQHLLNYVTYEGFYICDLVKVCHNVPISTLTHTIAEQLLLVIKDKLYHLLRGYSSKPLTSPQSISVSTGNEWANKQTEIITDQTIAVISFYIDLLALPSHQHSTVCCNLCPLDVQSDPKQAGVAPYIHFLSLSLSSLPLLPQNKAC